jgi:hypothetical protein
VVNRRLALLDACFILVATAIEAAGLLIHTVCFGLDILVLAWHQPRTMEPADEGGAPAAVQAIEALP